MTNNKLFKNKELENISNSLEKSIQYPIKKENNSIIIEINDNIIKLSYNDGLNLFLKTDLLDTEIITSETTILEDVLDLIKLYSN